MFRRLFSALAILSLVTVSITGSPPFAYAASGEEKVQEFRDEKAYLLSQLRKIDRKSEEYTEKRRRYQIISRKLRTLLKRNQVDRERPVLQRKAAQESSQAADPELKASPIVIQAPQKESTTQKKKRIHPIKLRKLKTDQDAPDGSATDSGSSDVLSTERGEASYYAEFFNGRTTASGTIFSNDDMTAAHRTMKFGSRVRVTNMDNGKSIEVEITDRGPYAKGRIIDLTREGFSRLDNISRGVMPVKVETLFVP